MAAKREAILHPRVAREFLTKYDGKPLPRGEISKNVLVSMGLPRDAAQRCLDVIVDNAKEVGAIQTIKGVDYVDLQGTGQEAITQQVPSISFAGAAEYSGGSHLTDAVPDPPPAELTPSVLPPQSVSPRKGRQKPAAAVNPTSGLGTAPPVRSPQTFDEARGDTGPLRRGLQVDAYRLDSRLGSGFSAEVWSATVVRVPEGVDVKPGQPVAIKFYHAHALALPDQVLRVEREYRIAQRIRHANLIRMYEFMLSSSRPNHNFLVMDLADGKPLKNQITPSGLSVQKAVLIIRQVLGAVAELHEAGALHRDIKPGNIAVHEDGADLHATLLDLGIINVMHERGVTAASHFVGSKHWAPYEQLVGDDIDARTDIYSVGAVMYNMLTGTEPYKDKGTEAAVAVEMNRRPLTLPTGLAVPEGILKLVNACLSTDPAARPATARACLAALDRA